MPYETTSYPLDCPGRLWDVLKRVQYHDRNINEELLVAIAAHVNRADVRLTDAERRLIGEILDHSSTAQPHQLRPEDWLRRTSLVEVTDYARI